MKKILFVTTLLIGLFTYISCSKSDPAPPSNPCAGVTINVSGSATNATTGQSDGSITVSGSGSSGLTYSLNGGTFQASTTFSNLAAGTYTINAKNANGCSGSTQVIVSSTNPCTGVNVAVAGSVTNATLANNDGSIAATATGGSGFTFSINGGAFQASGNFTNLSAGSYSITAKNSSGCTGIALFTVTNPCTGVTVNVTAVITNASTGQNNGSLNASATGGTGFTFSLNNGTFQGSGLFSNLAPGIYTITAKNSNGCIGSAQFTVTTVNVCTGVTITIATTVTSNNPCNPANGGIAVSASGGTAPYTYSINGGSFQSSNLFTGLANSTYTIGVRDANGCTNNASVIVGVLTPGPLFNAVKQVLATNCAISGCHVGPNPQNGLDFSINCTIVTSNSRIKARAVDANPSIMPPPPNPELSAADKQKIVNWINAGGRLND
ncbi:MAG: hypothetical protein WKF35_01240 [Ferruginibacter sp.]